MSPVRFDGSPSWYLTFYSNLSGRGVPTNKEKRNFLTLFLDLEDVEMHRLEDYAICFLAIP